MIPSDRTALSRDFYLAYLNSPAWRQRRNTKLRSVGWRCERCPSKRELQVHHRTYERLGGEFDSDLEVLCANCHEGHRLADSEISPAGVYVKLARQALRAEPFATIAELSEATKELCAANHVAVDGPKIHRALELLTGTRITRSPRPASLRAAQLRTADAMVLSPQVAHEILSRLGVDVSTIRIMPVLDTPAHEQRVLEQAAEIRRDIAASSRRRRPFKALLDDIFAGQA